MAGSTSVISKQRKVEEFTSSTRGCWIKLEEMLCSFKVGKGLMGVF